MRSLRTWLIAPACAWAALAAPAFAAGGSPQRPYVVVYESRPSQEFPVERETAARERKHRFESVHVFRHAIDGFAAGLTANAAEALRHDPEVALVAPDRTLHAARMPRANGETVPTGVARIGAAGPAGVHGPSGVAVAVLDTGVDLSHPDLAVRAGPNCTGTRVGLPDDDNGHGTHVAGVIGAHNTGAGVVGVAPGTELYAVKVLEASGDGPLSDIICGIDWVTANAAALGIRVVNLSFSGRYPRQSCADDPLHLALCRSAQSGLVYTVAAGNTGTDIAGEIPASYPEVLTVTGMSDSDGLPGGVGSLATCDPVPESDDAAATFSNYATQPADVAHTVAAPGACVESTARPGDPTVGSGTSVAAPHVAGVVALCMGEPGRPGPCMDMSPGEVIEQIRADAAANASPPTGFLGDPFMPIAGRFYGHLVSAHDPTVRRIAARPSAPAAPPPAAADRRVEVVLVRIPRRQDVDHLSVSVRLAERGTVAARARIRLGGAARLIVSRPATARAEPQVTTRLRLRVARAGLTRIKRGLHRGARLRARVSVTIHDAAGNALTKKRRVRLRP